MENKVSKKLHIEMLRIIAVVMVVLNHSDLYYTYYTNTNNIFTFTVSLLISSICKVNVPLFMMITGALLIPKAEKWELILTKRVSRMVIVLVSFSALIYGLKCFAWHQDIFSVEGFLRKLLTGEIQTSYWYLYEYIGILMMLPFLGAIARNIDNNCVKYFVLIGMIFKISLPIVCFLTGYSFSLNLFILENSVFYVLMGYFAERIITDEQCEQGSCGKVIVGLIICIFVTAGLVLIDKNRNGEYHEYILNMLTPVMVLFIYMGTRIIFIQHHPVRTAGIISCLGSCAFGVYLLEHIGQKVFLNLYLWLTEKTYGIIACSVYVFCILISCFACTMILKKVKIIRKLL